VPLVAYFLSFCLLLTHVYFSIVLTFSSCLFSFARSFSTSSWLRQIKNWLRSRYMRNTYIVEWMKGTKYDSVTSFALTFIFLLVLSSFSLRFLYVSFSFFFLYFLYFASGCNTQKYLHDNRKKKLRHLSQKQYH
jgi:predicted PurR-regulated permease PerM